MFVMIKSQRGKSRKNYAGQRNSMCNEKEQVTYSVVKKKYKIRNLSTEIKQVQKMFKHKVLIKETANSRYTQSNQRLHIVSVWTSFIPNVNFVVYNKQNIDQINMEFTAKLQLITRTMYSEEIVEKALKNAKKNYVFSEKDFRSLNSQSIVQLFLNKTLSKIEPGNKHRELIEQSKVSTSQNFWHPNEFKIFVWISVCHAYISNREIPHFTNEDLAFLQSLFPIKTMVFIEYNLRCMMKQDRSTKQNWDQQQLDMLCHIIKTQNLKGKWTDISFLLFEKSKKKYFRSSHKCREKWYNHLDPSVLHTKWTSHEDFQLFQLISEVGTRWASISKSMGGARTQHMVKNRYNSLSKKYAVRYQRYATKKLLDIILKDLKKKMEIEAKNIVKEEENIDESQKSSNNCLQTEQIKSVSEEMVNNIKTSSIKLEDFLNTTSLLPEWESFEFEQIGNCSSFDDMESYQPSYVHHRIELIDYFSIELQQYRCNFLQ